MRKLIGIFAFLFTLVFTYTGSFCDPLQLTIYNQGLASVREIRTLDLQVGLNRIKIDDIPALIDPTSVYFSGVAHPKDLNILEQNFDYDLVSQGKLWERFLGKEVEVEMVEPDTHKTVRKNAKLLSTGWSFADGSWQNVGTPIVEMDGKIYVQPPGQIILPAVSAQDFLLRPTLNWLLKSQVAGNQEIELSYLTQGISWEANYVVVSNEKENQVDLMGWVTLKNLSGTAFHDAKLKLMAGDLNVIQRTAAIDGLMAKSEFADVEKAPFQEKSFFEYHLYTLQRPATLLDNQTKQIELLVGHNIPAQKLYTYDGASTQYQSYLNNVGYRETSNVGPQSNKKVRITLQFLNSHETGLGSPLPRGVVRVYKNDTDGSRQFVGEDRIDHTPKDEKVKLYLGDAFDVVGERKQLSFNMIVPHHIYDETIQVDLRNHKDQPIQVNVLEHLWRWNDWSITNASSTYNKLDGHTVEFPVSVPANGSSRVIYTVRYMW